MDHTRNSSSSSPLEALEYPYQIFLIALYSLTACFAFVSNLLTIVVLVQGKRCTRDLRKFLINLSVTDLLLAVFAIPFTYTNYMLGRWIFFPVMCSIVNFAQLTTITVSIYTLVAIAIDRYFAIMHPLQKSISWFKTHRSSVVVIMWILGITIGLSQLVVSETKTFVHEGQVYTGCGEKWPPGSMAGKMYTLFIFLVTFALPMITLCIVYTAMGYHLLSYQMPGEQQLKQKSTRCNPFRKKKGKSDLNLDSAKIGTKCKSKKSTNKSTSKQYKSKSFRESTNNDESSANKKLQLLYLTGSDCQHSIANKPLADNRHLKCLNIPNIGTSETSNGTNYSHNGIQFSQNGHHLAGKTRGVELDLRERHSHLNCQSPVATPLASPIVQRRYSLRDQIGYQIKSKQPNLESINQKTLKIIYIRRNKVLKMLITIISVFTVCWLPIQIFTMLIYFRPDYLQVDYRLSLKYYTFVGTYFCCHWIAMAHSFMNPIIYSFMSKNFKEDVRHIFTRLWNKYVLRANFRASYSSYNHPLFAHYKVNSGLRRAPSNNFVTTTNDSTDPQVKSDSDSRQTPIVQSPQVNLDQKLSPLANSLQVESKSPPTTNKPPHYHKNMKCKSSKFVSRLRQNHSASSNNNKWSNKTPYTTKSENKSKSLIAKQFRANKQGSQTGSINRSVTTVIQTSPSPFSLQLDQCLQDIKSSTII